MRNRFLEAVLLLRADEQCEALGVRAKERPAGPTESPRLPVYRETGPRKPMTPIRDRERERQRLQSKALRDAWHALLDRDFERARAAAARLQSYRLTALRLRWVNHTSERWPL